ncbi:MAG TPA: hypothetical protein VKO86_02600 [Gemmatimonadales bacterium]|nr:hypothetical protein [Gemmatimonadales bacterium]
MARVRWWIGSTLLVCAAVGFAYLPPRAEPVFARRYREEPVPPYRYRVQELADAWRSTALELRLRQHRERLRPELERRRALEIPGPAVLLDWPAVPDSLSRLYLARLDSVWQDLRLGVSKISVGVVVAFDVHPSDPTTPSDPPPHTAYLLPDSTDRNTCIVYETFTRAYWSPPNLGPCAYYAAFGAPGREIERWLSGRQFDLAIAPLWTGPAQPSRTDGYFLSDIRNNARFWLQPAAVACVAGRVEGCRAAALESPPMSHDASRVVSLDRWWRPPALAGGTHYLADVVRSVGRERFQRFWNSELPVDTALAEALRMPVGEWTRRWQAGLVHPIRLGAAPSAGSAILAALLALAALGIVLRTAARRTVR